MQNTIKFLKNNKIQLLTSTKFHYSSLHLLNKYSNPPQNNIVYYKINNNYYY